MYWPQRSESEAAMSVIYVIYHSDTGKTHAVAKFLAEGAGKVRGAEVKVVAADELNLAEAARADGYAIGSPNYFNYVAGEIKAFFDKVLYDDRFKGKPYAAFCTHGGGGEVLGVIARLAKACGLKEVAAGVSSQGMPEEKSIEAARELGKALAKAAGQYESVAQPARSSSQAHR